MPLTVETFGDKSRAESLSRFALGRYRELRRVPLGDLSAASLYSAKTCLAIAKAEAAARAFPLRYTGDTLETADGFTVTIKIESDDLSREDLLGDTFGRLSWSYDWSGYRQGNGDESGWTLADVTDRSGRVARYWPRKGWTYAERLDQCRKAGMSRHVAHLAALDGLRREAERFASIERDGLESVWVQVTVTRDGEEYGEDSLGGIEGDSPFASIIDYDLLGNALSAARDRLQSERAERVSKLKALIRARAPLDVRAAAIA